MTDLGATGYGPRSRLLFNGDEEKYELWEVKFMGHLRLQKLHEVLTATTPDPENNARVYAELVQLLDDTSLSLVIREAKDDGKKAIKILREYYMGTSKPRIISLYTELTSLKMEGNESVTDYLIKAEKAATSLKSANEVIIDSLLVAMVLKGLPHSYKTFATVVTQREKEWTFMEFKVQLRSYEETEKACKPHKKTGPIDPPAREGFKYAITFVDDYSGVIMVYFLKHKSDTVAATERFLADSAPYGHDKKIRTDNGTEFTSAEFRSLLVKNCIKHEFSAPYSPHQNGTAERSWRTLFEMARCMLLGAKLPKKLWKYALRTAAYIRNRCYNPRTGKTPFEIMTGEKPNLKNMKIFGSLCYAYVQEKKKLDARCERGVFVGYDNQSPAYLVYLPEQDNLKRVRCVKFSQEQGVTNDAVEEYARPVPETEDKHSEEDEEDHNIKEERGENQDTKQERVSKEGREERRYPERLRTKPGHLEDYILDDDDEISAAKYSVDYCYHVADIPRTYEEAVSSPEHQLWYGAMKEEVNALNENDTYELVPLPEGKTVIGGKWVYAVKLGPNNTEKHKARYVAKGYSQVKDVDYGETFSPTARHTSIRMLMQLATQEGMKTGEVQRTDEVLRVTVSS
ncbi:hypothetical protein Pcinc_011828 [Petrolisthes cinctipes]|uniref:Integrase catalytic domain-containing protein n=1 Tax=Petrolisthes cinctipes TaxID=88211 RepID=A0AAE1G0J1_PETCI|nr:hypothetical protein Pcinc_011828 [Petrolisthes cinctipes]